MIEGSVSVKAAILGNKRTVGRLFCDREKHDKNTAFIIRQAESRNIPVERLPREEIDRMADGKTHGGLLALCGNRTYDPLSSALEADCPFVVILEGVEDPFNLGYIIRTLYTAGCTGLVIRNRDWSFSEPVILKSSAGASEYINLILSDDMASSLRYLKKQGCVTYAAMRKDAVSYLEADYRKPSVLLIGGEMRGLSSSVLRCSDQNIYIPYANDFRNALNAAAAAAVLGFEVFRQRTECL